MQTIITAKVTGYKLIVVTDLGGGKYKTERPELLDSSLSGVYAAATAMAVGHVAPIRGGGIEVGLEFWKTIASKGAVAAFYEEPETINT